MPQLREYLRPGVVHALDYSLPTRERILAVEPGYVLVVRCGFRSIVIANSVRS
jgi:hypothetical protein